MSMPPYDFWLQGPDEMGKWFLGPGIGCEGSRLVADDGERLRRPSAPTDRIGRGGHSPVAVQVIEVSGDRIVGHHNFLDPALFPLFGLPEHL